MSIPVALEHLADAIEEFGPTGYLMSGGLDGRPRVNHVRIAVLDGALRIAVGARTAAALAEHPKVSCLWPAVGKDGMNLIVDGEATVVHDGDRATAVITPTWAVRHVQPTA